MEFPRTRHKIEEVEFYFGHMEEHAQRAVFQEDGSFWDLTKFRFYLSAFLAAGMSVRDSVLRKEQKQAYLAAYPTWEAGLSADDRRVWDAMKDRRDEEVHLATMKVLREVALMPLEDARWRKNLPLGARARPMMGALLGEGEASIRIGVLAPVWETPDGGRTDVLSECRTYLGLLRGLLAACEQVTLPEPPSS